MLELLIEMSKAIVMSLLLSILLILCVMTGKVGIHLTFPINLHFFRHWSNNFANIGDNSGLRVLRMITVFDPDW